MALKPFSKWLVSEMNDPTASNELFTQALEMQLHRIINWLDSNGGHDFGWTEEIHKKLQECQVILSKHQVLDVHKDASDKEQNTSAYGYN